jgi:energy-coupling factor transport system permease protein
MVKKMKNKLIIGSFIDIDSFFHKITPLTKLVLFILISILVVNFHNFYGYLIFIITFLVGIFLSGIGLKNFFKIIQPLILLFLWTVLFQIIFTKKGTIVLDLYIIKIYSLALKNSMFLFLRMFILIGTAATLTLSTSPLQITHGLEDLLKPLKIFRVPVEAIALTLSISLRFIPLFFDEIEKIKIAQITKGYEVEELKLFEKVNYYGILLIPLLLAAVEKSEILAEAMRLRGYGSKNKKTRFYIYNFGKYDLLISTYFISLLTIIFFITN